MSHLESSRDSFSTHGLEHLPGVVRHETKTELGRFPTTVSYEPALGHVKVEITPTGTLIDELVAVRDSTGALIRLITTHRISTDESIDIHMVPARHTTFVGEDGNQKSDQLIIEDGEEALAKTGLFSYETMVRDGRARVHILTSREGRLQMTSLSCPMHVKNMKYVTEQIGHARDPYVGQTAPSLDFVLPLLIPSIHHAQSEA